LNYKEISHALSKSQTSIYGRIKRMEKDGVIKRYMAILDHTQINRSCIVFTHVSLKDHTKESMNTFEKGIIKFDEVMECYHMTGGYDFILRVAVSDMKYYHNWLMNDLFPIVPLAHVESTLVMKEAKMETAYKLDIQEKAAKKTHSA
ncbi:MAG: Lrp/AsnC family transcriptional regulator, partial [Sphingobacteriales bacterium]